MSKVSFKPGALLAPVPPAMISCGTEESANIITVAWTGIVNTLPPMTYISIRPERYSYNIIKESGEFVINLTTEKLARAADWCGARTGAKFDKFKELSLTKEPSVHLSCPMVGESPISFECKVKEILHFGSHDMFIASIVGMNIDESLIDEKGRINIDNAGLCAFAHGEYFALGKKLGGFGFSVRKKKPHKGGRKNNVNKK